MEHAVKAGAKIIAGGKVNGAMFEATLLENVGRECDLYRKEAFGPVAILEKFDDFKQALDTVNDSDFGLQAGIFHRLARACASGVGSARSGRRRDQ